MQPFCSRRVAVSLSCVLFVCGVVRAAGPGKATAPPVGSAALPATKPSAFTWHDFFAQQLAFNRETLGGAYKRVGNRGAWDEQAVAFLDRAARRITYAPARPLYVPADVPTPAELADAGKKLLDAGCTDPAVRYCYGVALEQAGRLAEAGEMLNGTAAELEAAGYPSYRVWAALDASQRVGSLNPRVAPKNDALTLKHAVLMACGKFDGPGEGDGARRYVFEQLWGRLEPLERWQQVEVFEGIKERPDGDRWITLMLEGVIEIKLAWDSRGYGWANTVTEEGWRGFQDHLTKSRDALAAAHKLRPQLPNAAVEMITVAMGDGERLGVDEMDWFKRALAAQIDCRTAYDGIYQALKPRWGGSHDAIYEIGMEAVRTGRYDIEGPWQLCRAVDTIGIDLDDRPSAYRKPGVYEALDEMAANYVKAHAKDGKDARFITFRAALAWRTGRYKVARKHLEQVGGRVVPQAFELVASEDPPAAIGHSFAMSGARAAAVERAEAALADGDEAAALAAFRAVRGAADVDPREVPYLDARIARLDHADKLRTGEWIDVQPRDAKLKGWTIVEGAWQVQPDGSLLGRGASGTNAQILLDKPLGDRFEWSGRAVLTDPKAMPPGFLIGQDGRPVLTEFLPGGNFRVAGRGRAAGGVVAPPAADGSITFTVTYDKDTLRATVNGAEVQNGKVRFDNRVTNGQVGLTLFGEATFTQLKIRKITDKQPAAGQASADKPAGGGANDGFD